MKTFGCLSYIRCIIKRAQLLLNWIHCLHDLVVDYLKHEQNTLTFLATFKSFVMSPEYFKFFSTIA